MSPPVRIHTVIMMSSSNRKQRGPRPDREEMTAATDHVEAEKFQPNWYDANFNIFSSASQIVIHFNTAQSRINIKNTKDTPKPFQQIKKRLN